MLEDIATIAVTALSAGVLAFGGSKVGLAVIITRLDNVIVRLNQMEMQRREDLTSLERQRRDDKEAMAERMERLERDLERIRNGGGRGWSGV